MAKLQQEWRSNVNTIMRPLLKNSGLLAWMLAVGIAFPLHAQSSSSSTDQDEKIQKLQDKLEEIQQQIIELRQSRSNNHAQEHLVSAVNESIPPAVEEKPMEERPQEPVPPPTRAEPFAFADFTWLTGNARTIDTPYATKFFTPEIRSDVNYTYDFRHPQDNTIGGSSEIFRANEVQLTQFGVGGDFHYDNVRARVMTQFGLYSQTTPRNDASPARGQWNLADAYRYLSEAYGGYHFNVQHGINVDAGIFMSYVGLFSYYQFDNWAYQPSYVSSNTPWFFNGVRVQWFPTAKLKIEPWFINGWQSYGRFNNRPGLGGQILYRPNGNWSIVGNQYGFGEDALGVPTRTRYHTDDSVQYKYYDRPTSFISKAAATLTGDAGCESGGGVSCFGNGKTGPKQSFLGFMAYNRVWFDRDRYAITLGGGEINNPGRYLVLLPPINGATAASGTPYFTENPGDPFKAWDASFTADYMPSQYFTYRLEYNHRAANVPYFTGPGGVTPPGGNTGAPGSVVPNWAPDLRYSENRMTVAFLVKF
jgi:Putative beta-barrel porin-2, OmpL-like. bbp2